MNKARGFNPESINRKIAKLKIKTEEGKTDISHLHRVDIVRDQAADAQEWCEQRFGDEWIWSSPILVEWTAIYLKTSEDALAFSLTFAGSLVT